MTLNSVWKLLNDLNKKDKISEIVINSPAEIFVEKEGSLGQLNCTLKESDVTEFIQEVAKSNHIQCLQKTPIFDGVLPDKSRINVVNLPFSYPYPAISIRKFHIKKASFEESPDLFDLGASWINFLRSLVHSRMNIVVSGGTSSGKTTLMNLLINEIALSERIVSIEDTLELQFNRKNVVRLESKRTDNKLVTVRDLVKNTLRMRPDRIILGESRGEELFDFLQAMNTGHEGSMTTIHSNSPKECLSRLEGLYLLAGYNVPRKAILMQIANAVDFIIQVKRLRNGLRVVSEIMEIAGCDGENILVSNLATRKNELLTWSGVTPKKMSTLSQKSGIQNDFFNSLK